MHKTATLFFSLMVAASLWSRPVFALEHRPGVTGNSCDFRAYTEVCVPPSRNDGNPLPRVATDLIRGGSNGDHRPLRMDMRFGKTDDFATHLGEWMIADVAAVTVHSVQFRQIGPSVFPPGREFRLSLDKSPLFVADTGIRYGADAYERPVTGARDSDDMSVFLDDAGKPGSWRKRRERSGDTREAGQGNGLSLLQNFPLSLPDVQPSGNTEGEGQWARLPDSPFPEPGSWAVLIAGLLGMCAVARPRLYSS